MDATFVIGFHTQRFDNLLQTLRFLKENHEDFIKYCQLVTVCQDEVNKANISKAELDTATMIVGGNKTMAIGEFNYWARYFGRWDHFDMKVECMQLPAISNFGVEKSVADKIFLLESDRILPRGYFQTVSEVLKSGYQITTKDILKLRTPVTDDQIRENDFQYTKETRSPSAEAGMRSMWSGNTAFMKRDFYKCGRMDENYKGYGWADNDMTLTMEANGIRSLFQDELEIHLWHPIISYNGEKDSKMLFIQNGVRFCEKWDKHIPTWLQDDIDEIHRRNLI